MSTNSSISQVVSTAASYEGSALSVGSQPELQQAPSEKAAPELQRMLEELHISNIQQVILVPEAGKLGFSFGSFDASFGLEMTQDGSLGSDKSNPLSESSDSIAEPTEVLQLRSLSTFLFCSSAKQSHFPHVLSGRFKIVIKFHILLIKSRKLS